LSLSVRVSYYEPDNSERDGEDEPDDEYEHDDEYEPDDCEVEDYKPDVAFELGNALEPDDTSESDDPSEPSRPEDGEKSKRHCVIVDTSIIIPGKPHAIFVGRVRSTNKTRKEQHAALIADLKNRMPQYNTLFGPVNAAAHISHVHASNKMPSAKRETTPVIVMNGPCAITTGKDNWLVIFEERLKKVCYSARAEDHLLKREGSDSMKG
jgi:hypothetical protein